MKKEHQKLQKYRVLKIELERMWRVKALVGPVRIGVLWAVTSELGEWLHQIPGITPEISDQWSTILKTNKILLRTLGLQGL